MPTNQKEQIDPPVGDRPGTGHDSELLGGLPSLNAATPMVVFSAEEPNQPIIDSVCAALVKSRTSNKDLLAILYDLIRQSRAE